MPNSRIVLEEWHWNFWFMLFFVSRQQRGDDERLERHTVLANTFWQLNEIPQCKPETSSDWLNSERLYLTSGSVSGAAFVLVAVEHALAPVGALPAVGATPRQVQTRTRLVQLRAWLRPGHRQCRLDEHEPGAALDRQRFHVVCAQKHEFSIEFYEHLHVSVVLGLCSLVTSLVVSR